MGDLRKYQDTGMTLGLVIAIRTLVMVLLLGLTGVVPVAAIGAVTAATALTGNALVISISDTGVVDPDYAVGYTENVVDYRRGPRHCALRIGLLAHGDVLHRPVVTLPGAGLGRTVSRAP